VSHDSTITLALLIVIIGALVAVSVAWGVNLAKISRLEEDMRDSKADRAKLREEASKDRTEVATVRTTLGNIVSMLEDVRRTLHADGRKTG
jgi:predicted permease